MPPQSFPESENLEKRGMVTFEAIVDTEMLMKLAPTSIATAFANIVLPVPSGPNNNRPLYGYAKHAENSVKQIHFLA